jgi:CubicO group peptidase (beta-lactamase class C family)
MSKKLNRRKFLQSATLGAGLAFCMRSEAADAPVAREALMPATPEDVGVSSPRLQEALDFLTKEYETKTFPGAALVATRGGRKFVEKYWGTYASPEKEGVPFDGSVQCVLYSFSKAITATVAVMTHQDGLIDYDAPVSRYIGEFVGGGKEKITVRHLLTHAAGIPNAPLDPVYTEEQWKTAIGNLCKLEIEWEPGSKTAYHGVSGMLLVAEVVRRVSNGKPWNDICRERLFDPLGAGFVFGMPRADCPVAIVPPPKTLPTPIDVEHIRFLGHPSGGVFGRPHDILKLLNLHLNKGIWNSKTLIKPDALAEMHRIQYQKEIDAALASGENPKHEYWGLGWNLRGATNESWFGFGSVASSRSFGHAGIDTVIGVADPERDIALAFLTTASPGEAANTMRLRNTVTNKVMVAAR